MPLPSNRDNGGAGQRREDPKNGRSARCLGSTTPTLTTPVGRQWSDDDGERARWRTIREYDGGRHGGRHANAMTRCAGTYGLCVAGGRILVEIVVSRLAGRRHDPAAAARRTLALALLSVPSLLVVPLAVPALAPRTSLAASNAPRATASFLLPDAGCCRGKRGAEGISGADTKPVTCVLPWPSYWPADTATTAHAKGRTTSHWRENGTGRTRGSGITRWAKGRHNGGTPSRLHTQGVQQLQPPRDADA
ncbi:hypothetical protein BJ912DRAFT_1047200 [Pholiota molesta]|nr:hypothetical protein BJ912DRAFT_1047200 [Pholiota molesta]